MTQRGSSPKGDPFEEFVETWMNGTKAEIANLLRSSTLTQREQAKAIIEAMRRVSR
jgi:hypothetical protein